MWKVAGEGQQGGLVQEDTCNVISHVLLVLVSDTVVLLITDNYDDYLDSSEWVTVDCTSKVLH